MSKIKFIIIPSIICFLYIVMCHLMTGYIVRQYHHCCKYPRQTKMMMMSLRDNLLRPPLYMRSIIDENITRWHMMVHISCFLTTVLSALGVFSLTCDLIMILAPTSLPHKSNVTLGYTSFHPVM
jgi:hypothetical protein